MILALQRIREQDTVLALDPHNKTMIFINKSQIGIPLLPKSHNWLSGFAGITNGSVCAMYKYLGSLWVSFDERQYQLTREIKSTWSIEGEERSFCLYKSDAQAERYQYAVEPIDPAIEPFVIWGDEEQMDILLWIHNILCSAERQTIVLDRWNGEGLLIDTPIGNQ